MVLKFHRVPPMDLGCTGCIDGTSSLNFHIPWWAGPIFLQIFVEFCDVHLRDIKGACLSDAEKKSSRDHFPPPLSTTARARPLATACTYCGPGWRALRLTAVLGRPRSSSLRRKSPHAIWAWPSTTGHCAARHHDPIRRRHQRRPDRGAEA